MIYKGCDSCCWQWISNIVKAPRKLINWLFTLHYPSRVCSNQQVFQRLHPISTRHKIPPLTTIAIQYFFYLESSSGLRKGLLVRLSGVLRPTREFFTHMEISPLPVKSCKFWPIFGTLGHCNWAVRVFFSVPHLVWHGSSDYNSHLWGPVTHLSLNLWQWRCLWYLFLWLRFSQGKKRGAHAVSLI